MGKRHSFNGQHEDEEILDVFRYHPIVMRKGLVGLLILAILGSLPIIIWPTNLNLLWLFLIGIILGSLYMFYEWVGWYYSVFIVTNQRFVQMTQKGFFNKSVVDLGLNKIQNINYQISGLQQTMLAFGTIVIQTFMGDLVLENIHHPEKIQTRLIKVMKKYGHQETEEVTN